MMMGGQEENVGLWTKDEAGGETERDDSDRGHSLKSKEERVDAQDADL